MQGKELQTGSKDLLSESAKKQRSIDRLLENLKSDDSADWCTAIIAMEERAAAREMDYRRELDAQRRADEERRDQQEARREERFLVLIAEIIKKQD
ncbi:hypothetical protein PPTG_13294 [Phytophthora nicotianae INRA-310]|uniref:Uncharacterized protein n=1 Tax=Phytophthora nicotianae (strain INRA-310) TaxID=761204 RepID=W2Q2K6_PHYN3|nr:hypothetical protein PPTG_13294 [Phytophthora nicotianae INRA-310]ETN07362.1 hypothetical protein PPTG_13294 [Phytophthora nicotianae INRA-310]